MNSHQRRKHRRKLNLNLTGNRRKMRRFKIRLAGALQIPLKYLYGTSDRSKL